MAFMNHLITRSGLARGVLINGTGSSITDTPGAGNQNVGGYYLDYSGLFANNQVGIENLPMVDNEFSAVIADGRYLENESSGFDDEFLLDEEENPEDMDGTMVDDATRMLTVETVSVDMRFIAPSFNDAGLWFTDPETGEISAGFDQATLEEYLDKIKEPAEEVGANGDINVWHPYAPNLRWTLHWALMVIDCTNVVDQGVADFQSENSPINVARSPLPVAGPRGVLLNYGTVVGLTSDDAGGMRLWAPMEGSQGIRIVARGEREYPYTYRPDRAVEAPPNASYDTDLSSDPLQPVDAELAAVHDDASSVMEGRNISLRVNLRRRVKLKDDQLLVFTVQTGRARLFRGVGGDNPEAGQVLIAGSPGLAGRNGPTLRMYHHAVRATGRSRA